jgi:hypothetical protein
VNPKLGFFPVQKSRFVASVSVFSIKSPGVESGGLGDDTGALSSNFLDAKPSSNAYIVPKEKLRHLRRSFCLRRVQADYLLVAGAELPGCWASGFASGLVCTPLAGLPWSVLARPVLSGGLAVPEPVVSDGARWIVVGGVVVPEPVVLRVSVTAGRLSAVVVVPSDIA